jgi:tetratricopeptide (TPR) repeat protein
VRRGAARAPEGIIHRDIKPSNVLVSVQDDRPLVKVIDFGIAKATEARLTEKTVFTEERQLIGTPQYMSPEQAGPDAANVDTRADVYSLGVLLYELLTGNAPFDVKRLRSAAFGEIQRIIREEDPPKPSTRLSTLGAALTTVAQQRQSAPGKLTKLVRGDLDWIVMRAMEKDRARRYDTASALAEDVRRHLADEPVVASPPTAAYRVHKFVRRHRTGVLAGALVAAALVTGASLAAVGLVQAQRGRAEAVRQRAYAESRQREAERQTRIAEEVKDFLTEDLLAAADPQNARGREVTVRDVLDAASSSVADRFDGEPTVEASVRSTLGNTYWKLGRAEAAAPHLERAVALRRATLGDDHPDTLTSLNRLAGVYRGTGRLKEAEPIYAEVLQKRKRVLGPEHPDTLSSMHNLAGLYRDQGRLDDALPVYQDALAIAQRTLPPESLQRLTAMEGLAGMYKDLGRHADAEPLYVEVLTEHRKTEGDDHPATLRTMNNLGVVYSRLGRYAESEQLYAAALAAERRVLGDDHPETLVTLTNLAKLHYLTRRFEDAVVLYAEAIERARRVLGDGHRGTIMAMDGLGQTYNQMGRYAEAEKLFSDGIRRADGSPGMEPVSMMLHHNLAITYVRTDRAEAAEKCAAHAVAAARRALPRGHWFTGQFLLTHGDVLVKLGRFQDAEAALLEAQETLAKAQGSEHALTGDAVRSLTTLYEAWGKPDEASKWRVRLAVPDTTPSR